MKELIGRFAKNESGATAIEYGLIAGLVAVALIAALTAMQGKLSGTFNLIGSKLPQSEVDETGCECEPRSVALSDFQSRAQWRGFVSIDDVRSMLMSLRDQAS